MESSPATQQSESPCSAMRLTPRTPMSVLADGAESVLCDAFKDRVAIASPGSTAFGFDSPASIAASEKERRTNMDDVCSPNPAMRHVDVMMRTPGHLIRRGYHHTLSPAGAQQTVITAVAEQAQTVTTAPAEQAQQTVTALAEQAQKVTVAESCSPSTPSTMIGTPEACTPEQLTTAPRRAAFKRPPSEYCDPATKRARK